MPTHRWLPESISSSDRTGHSSMSQPIDQPARLDSHVDHRRSAPGGNTARALSLQPPWHGSSPAPFVCGGPQGGISLAAGTFTGESRRNPPAVRSWKKRPIIKDLPNHDHGALDSFAESGESSLWKPPRRKPASGSKLAKHLQNSGLTRDEAAFASRRIGASLVRWLRRHISCAHRLSRAPGPSGVVRARWRWAAKANATDGRRRSFEPVRRL